MSELPEFLTNQVEGAELTALILSPRVTALRTRSCGPGKASVVPEQRSPPSWVLTADKINSWRSSCR
jgi:hypothetical protein